MRFFELYVALSFCCGSTLCAFFDNHLHSRLLNMRSRNKGSVPLLVNRLPAGVHREQVRIVRQPFDSPVISESAYGLIFIPTLVSPFVTISSSSLCGIRVMPDWTKHRLMDWWSSMSPDTSFATPMRMMVASTERSEKSL